MLCHQNFELLIDLNWKWLRMGTEAVFVNLCGVDFGDLARLHLLVKLAHDQMHTLDFSVLEYFRVRNYCLRLRVLLLKFEAWL